MLKRILESFVIITIGLLLDKLTAGSAWPKNDIDNLNAFLEAGLIRFAANAEQLGSDPLPILEGLPLLVNYTDDLLQITGTLWDIKQIGLASLYPEYITSSLTGDVTTWTKLANNSITGQYNLSGTILSSLPVSGVGAWSITPGFHHVNMYAKFDIEDGYAVVDIPNIATSYIAIEIKGGFPELAESLGEELAEDVQAAIGWWIFKDIQAIAGRAISRTIYQFINAEFAETPFLDIISGTPPPTTTTQPTNPPTTPAPNCTSPLPSSLLRNIWSNSNISVNTLYGETETIYEVTIIKRYAVPNM